MNHAYPIKNPGPPMAGIFLFICISYISPAQPPRKTAHVNATAAIGDSRPAEILTIRELTLTPGDIDESMKLSISPRNSTQAAVMKTSGQPHEQASITFLPGGILRGPRGSLDIRYFMAGNKDHEQKAATLFNASRGVITFSENGAYYLWIGAESDLSPATEGEYNGQITLEIEYQ